MSPNGGARRNPPDSDVDAALLHGWSGLGVAYAAVQAPMVAGMIRGRAELRKYWSSPLLAAPLTVVAGICTAAAESAFGWLGLPASSIVQFALASTASVTLGYFGGRSIALTRPHDKIHQRGSRVDETSIDHEPRTASATSRARGGRRDLRITLAGTPVAAADETKHFKLIGTTGTGKSTAIQEILSSALARGDRAVVADPDGGYLKRFYDASRGDVVLNPFDRRSVKWDLFGEIEDAYDVDQLARSLIPDHDGTDRSWRDYARTFFAAVTRQAHQGGVTDIAELYRLLVVADASELRTLVKGTPAQPFLEEHNSRMFDSIRSVTSSAVGAIDYVAQQNAPAFSVRKWVRHAAPGVLFMPYKAGQIAALRSTISGWMRLAIFEAMNQEEQPDERAARRGDARDMRRVWFVVDELDALGQIDGLKDALARMRKFGGRCVLGFQSVAQVSTTYGQGDARTIIENCGNTLILRCSASEGGGTARFASQLIGDREILRTTESRNRRHGDFFGSTTHSEHFMVEPAVLPSQIEQLPDLAGYLKHASNPEWRRVRLDAVRQWLEHCSTVPGGAAEPRLGREGPAHE